MTALPPTSDFIGPTRSEGQMKATFSDMRAFLAGLLGSDGTKATALGLLGAMVSGYALKTAAYTVNLGDRGALIATSGSWTLGLLAAATAGPGFAFVLRTNISGSITIDPNGSELIDGAATLVLGPGRSGLIICTGAGWLTLGFGGDITGRMLAADGTVAAPATPSRGTRTQGLTTRRPTRFGW